MSQLLYTVLQWTLGYTHVFRCSPYPKDQWCSPRLHAQPPLTGSGCETLGHFSAVAVSGVFFFFSPLQILLPSETLKFPTDIPVRVSYCVETSPPSWLPPQDGSPALNLLSQFLSFIFCPTSFWRDQAAWQPGVLHQRSDVMWKLLNIQMIFWWIVREKVFLCHLGTALPFFNTENDQWRNLNIFILLL